jgi:hypothetical protein
MDDSERATVLSEESRRGDNDDQVIKMREERDIVEACGYGFVVGVSTEAHKEALEQAERDLEIVVTGCKR